MFSEWILRFGVPNSFLRWSFTFLLAVSICLSMLGGDFQVHPAVRKKRPSGGPSGPGMGQNPGILGVFLHPAYIRFQNRPQ